MMDNTDARSLINAEFIVNQLIGADDDLRARLVEDLAGAFSASQRAYNQSDVNQSKVLRVLQSGSAVTTDTAGLTKDLSSKSLFKTLDFRGQTVQIDASNHEIARILGGAGSDCLFDYLVSSCWATAVAAGTGTEGQVIPTISGCTFKIYSTLQGAITYAALFGSTREYRMVVCAGTYTEDVIVPASMNGTGITIEAVTYGRNYVDFMTWPVTIQAATNYAIDLPGSDYASTRLTFKGIKFAGAGGNPSIRWGSNTLAPPNLRFENCGIGGLTARNALADLTLSDCKFITYGIDSTAASGGQAKVWEMEGVEFANLPLDLTFTAGLYYGYQQTSSESVLRMRNCRNVSALNVLGATLVDLDNVYFRYDNARAYTAQFVQDVNSAPYNSRVNLHDCLFSAMDTAQGHVDVLKFNYTGADSVGGVRNTFVNITKCEFLFPNSSGATFHYVSFNKAATTSAGRTYNYRDTLILSNTFNGQSDIAGGTGVLSAAVVTEGGAVLASPLIVDNVPTTATVTVATTGSPVIGNAPATGKLITYAADSTLSANRVLTAGSNITITDAGVDDGAITIAATAPAAATAMKMTYISFGTSVTGYSV